MVQTYHAFPSRSYSINKHLFSFQAPIVQDDPNMKVIIFESLQLRLSLIGGMFDTIVVGYRVEENRLCDCLV